MVDLARQAFSTKKFGLAAEIYEGTIKENGPNADLFLGLADSFARGGQFTKSFEAYTNAFRLGRIGPENLKHLVTALIESLSQDSAENKRITMSQSCMFTCVLCRGLLLQDPVTIKCGHTFCRKCLERDDSKTCPVCSTVHSRLKPYSYGTNVVLSNLIRKWFPENCRAADLKAEGNTYFEKLDFKAAIKYYTDAISLCGKDHLLFSNRSDAFLSLEQYHEALEDAEKVVALRPDWPKGFFRKGTALYELGRYEEAVIAFLQCLALDKEVDLAKECLSKSLHKVLCQLPPDDPKSQQKCNPTVFQRLLDNNFHLATLLPETLSQLKRIMDETVETASNFKPPVGSVQGAPAASAPRPAVGSDNKSGADLNTAEQENMRGHLECSCSEKHRCDSVPTLQETASSSSSEQLQQEQARCQSPEREVKDSPSSKKRCRIPSTTNLMSPTRSPLKCIKSVESPLTAAPDVKSIDPSLLNAEDLECSLCYRLFYTPVTIPCGHSFCRQCLDRCLDHQTSCPMCKSSLTEYLAERRSTVTEALQNIIITYFSKECEERRKLHEEELGELAQMGKDTQHEIPVFVCTISFPSVQCPLHIFEPRYRLMIRQCMESGTRQFGMCPCFSENEENFSDYGCMLEIRDVHFFPDGRSLVDTIGGRRFRVLSRGKRDGYNTAKVEFLQDDCIDEADLPEIQKLQVEIYGRVEHWLNRLPVLHKTRISEHFGQLPALDPNLMTSQNGPAWAWWCVAVLPIESRIQMALLAMCSFKERLDALEKVLKYLSHRRQ